MLRKKRISNLPFHLMILPGLILTAIFSYGPILGIVIAFQNFIPARGMFGSDWIGLGNFSYMLSLSDTFVVLKNTIYIAAMKIVAGQIAPIITALMLNETRKAVVKRSV
jgi:putative aldouronate transport system permease protein